MNQQTAAMLNNPANVPTVNNNANIKRYLKQQVEQSKKNQTSLLHMAKKSMNTLLQTKKKMFPMAGKTKLASNSPQFSITNESFANSQDPYRFSDTNEQNLLDAIETTNNKIRLLMEQINKKNNVITLINYAIISIIFYGALFGLYSKNMINKVTTLLLFVFYTTYISYLISIMYYNPEVMMNDFAILTNEVRERVCKDI
jgi:hypothetical protein